LRSSSGIRVPVEKAMRKQKYRDGKGREAAHLWHKPI
jgi:hypothetical protein